MAITGDSTGATDDADDPAAPDTTPAVARYRIAAADPDEALAYMAANYTRLEPQPTPRAGFEFWVQGASAGLFAIDALRHSSSLRAHAEPPEQLIVAQPAQRTQLRNTTAGHDARGPLVLAPSSRYTVEWHDATMAVVTLDRGAVARVGAELSGLDERDVVFTGTDPLSPALTRSWANLCAYVRRDLLAHDEVMSAPLMRVETFRHLATTLLATFPNTALDTLNDPTRSGPGRTQPATVRRAAAFIDAHATEAIGLTEIARAAGIGARGLQHAFRRHRDTTPLGYLRQVRLERAHRDLRAADPTRGDTVAAIAARWGFTHPGRFSADYRRTYGCAPSETLRT